MAIEKFEGWKTSDGKFYGDEKEAKRAEGRYNLELLVNDCLSGYDSEIDFEGLIARRDRIIEAFRDIEA